jgi:hypothetical protein
VTVIVPRFGATGLKHQRIGDRVHGMHIAGQDVPTQALDDVGEREALGVLIRQPTELSHPFIRDGVFLLHAVDTLRSAPGFHE